MFKTNVISAAVEKTQQMSSAFSLREYQNKKSKQTNKIEKKGEREEEKNTIKTQADKTNDQNNLFCCCSKITALEQ